MNRPRLIALLATAAFVWPWLAAAQGQAPPVRAMAPTPVAFTYQGSLSVSGLPADGYFDFRFTVYDAGGDYFSSENPGVPVSGGLFTTTVLSPSSAPVYEGEQIWMKIEVRPAGASTYTTLSPDVALLPAPLALLLRVPTSSKGASDVQPLFTLENSGIAPALRASSALIAVAGTTDGTTSSIGVMGASTLGKGVVGVSGDPPASMPDAAGVWGYDLNGHGVHGETASGYGIYGKATSGRGVFGDASTGPGVYGHSTSTYGLVGISGGSPTLGFAVSHAGVAGFDSTGAGVHGYAGSGTGVHGVATSGTGVLGSSSTSHGVSAVSAGPYREGAALSADNVGTYGMAAYMTNASTWATAHLQNDGTGQVLWLVGNGGDLIDARTSTNRRFLVTGAGEVYADGTFHANGADFAELLPGEAGLEAGDVLAVSEDGSLVRSRGAFDPAVVGVFSTEPGFLGGSPDVGHGGVPLAVVGIVPVKASAENGPIHAGDLLVAASDPGTAMRAGASAPDGTVIGKALSSLAEGAGTVRLLVMLQ